MSRINKIHRDFLHWQILSLVYALRNHVTSRLSHQSLSACKDGGYLLHDCLSNARTITSSLPRNLIIKKFFCVVFDVVSASTLSLSKRTPSDICNSIEINLLIGPQNKDCRLGFACPIRTLSQNLFVKFHLCSSLFNVYASNN